MGPPLASSRVELHADPGEANDLKLSVDGRFVEIEFSGAPLEAGKGCRKGGARLVRCKPTKPKSFHLPGFPGHANLFPVEVVVDLDLDDRDDRIDARAMPPSFDLRHRKLDLAVLASGGEGSDVIATGRGDDELVGGPGDDLVGGGPGSDVLSAGRGADGSDLLDGGPGSDILDYLRRRAPVTLSLDDLANDGGAGEGDFVSSTENILGGAGDDLVVGDDGRSTFFGLGGDDNLIGGGGRDFLLGDFFGELRGDDRLEGGDGGDVLIGGFGRDALLAGAGDDEVDAVSTDEGGKTDQRDQVDCGLGSDRGRAQRKDVLTDCERVRIVKPDRRAAESLPGRAALDRRFHGLAHRLGEQGIGILAPRLGRRDP
jgi:Ca2+-binding RTX toxin-like protein